MIEQAVPPVFVFEGLIGDPIAVVVPLIAHIFGGSSAHALESTISLADLHPWAFTKLIGDHAGGVGDSIVGNSVAVLVFAVAGLLLCLWRIAPLPTLGRIADL